MYTYIYTHTFKRWWANKHIICDYTIYREQCRVWYQCESRDLWRYIAARDIHQVIRFVHGNTLVNQRINRSIVPAGDALAAPCETIWMTSPIHPHARVRQDLGDQVHEFTVAHMLAVSILQEWLHKLHGTNGASAQSQPNLEYAWAQSWACPKVSFWSAVPGMYAHEKAKVAMLVKPASFKGCSTFTSKPISFAQLLKTASLCETILS